MGCLSSKEKGSSSSIVESKEQQETSKGVAAAATTTTKTTTPTTGGEIYTDDDGEALVFFDALESFSDAVAHLSYAPASTMRARGVSMLSPNTLLSVRHLDGSSTLSSSLSPSTSLPPSSSLRDDVVPTMAAEPTGDSSKGGSGNGNNANKRTTTRESVVAITKSLEAVSSGISGHGYPGELNEEELHACIEFREQLKKRDDPTFRDMVSAYSPAEEEAFALCRFLRARQFNPQNVFTMLEENKSLDIWKKAKQHNFYQDFESIYGCPVPVFMGLFPLVVSGLAKNGATILHFKSGNMNIDALECVADLPELVPAMWDLLHTKGRLSMEREGKTHDPNMTTVLAERIIIVDMKGIPSAFFSSRGIEFMKETASITACFPETMNRTYLINVPTSFSIIWSIIKVFLEARTLAKIGFFSNPIKAKQDLLKFIDSNELLSEYGGTGPSFEDVVTSQQRELGNCSRYIVQHLYVTQKESNWTFDLTKDERVESIVVYTKAEHTAHFSVKKGTTVLVQPTKVERGDGNKHHYSVAMALPEKKIVGPDKYIVTATGSGKEHYVVAVSINQGK